MININVVLGPNVFHAEGELLDMREDVVSMFRTWLNAQNLDPAVTLEQLTEKLKAQNDALALAVELNTPAPKE